MKNKPSLFIVSFLFFCLAYAGNEELETYGLKMGLPYSKARSILIKNGWKPMLDSSSVKTSLKFPEISCGSGKDAVCSAGFKRDKQYVAFILKSLNRTDFILDGTY